MSTLREHFAAYLSQQRATARAIREQAVSPAEDQPRNTMERVAAAIVSTRATGTAKAAPVVIPFPKTDEAARDAMAVILANATRRGGRLWADV